MKLKYYLRGLGMGIIFATLILTISSVIHNNNLSEEKIIKEAKKLGMVIPEETESNQGGLWDNNDAEAVEDETQALTEHDTAVESDILSESDSMMEDNTENTTVESTTQEPESTEKTTQEDGKQVKGDNGVTYIIINVYPGDAARQVAERLYENKLVDDSEAFRKYLGQSGKARSLAVGEYMIPMGATYDQIIDVLMRR